MGLFYQPSQLLNELSPLTLTLVLTVAALALLGLALLKRVLYPTHDPREPPVLRPRIPLIGHAISIAREGGGYYERLYREKRMPICTLPVLAGKIYVINSPALISAAMRSRTLSFDPFVEQFSTNALGLSEREKERFRDPAYISLATQPIHASLTGEPLRELAVAALKRIAADLNGIRRGDDPKGLDWLRDVVSQAIMGAIYGQKNPMTPEVHRHIWEFEKKVAILALGVAPRLLARKALAARSVVQSALREYYVAGHDRGPDVSAFVKRRAEVKRKLGVQAADMAGTEFDIPWASVTNTLPSLVWLVLHVFSRPEYRDRLRAEVLETTVTTTTGSAVIDASGLAKKPFASACFQEVLRRYSNATGNRRVMEDTVLQDVDGREYLLKKGTNIQWLSGVPQLDASIWGDDAEAFRPERWIDAPAHEEKKRRGAMIPFGGGKHLCPGRMFAWTELIAVVGALALAFDVEGARLPPGIEPPIPGAGMRRPLWDGGKEPTLRISRREGWDDVQLGFAV